MGFRFESDPYEQWAKKCKENETLYRGYLKNNLSAEMKECLGYYLNPTEENYRKVGLLNSKDSNIMMDKGGCYLRFWRLNNLLLSRDQAYG